ncbi:MAG: plastocyanin/azurin family copper-binding protein [Pseudomonadota bacterium]|nr:plastocyanin/azurin family copper-binding protein [Pseudomonadota bacterium]
MFSLKDKGFKVTIELNHLLKAIKIVLLLIIAYNSGYLKGIYHGLENLNQEDKVIVNVGSIQPKEHGVVKNDGKKPSSTTDSAVIKPSQPKETKTEKTKAQAQEKMATTPEENLNPVTHKVEMLNNSPDGAMVFSPPFIHIKTGDSIEFVPASYGHNVQTPEDIIGGDQAIPKGASPFKGAMNESLIVKFTVPGVYLYVCNYHYIVGHVGVIQVGNDSHNLDSVKEAGEKLKGKIFSHPERVDKYLGEVKTF